MDQRGYLHAIRIDDNRLKLRGIAGVDAAARALNFDIDYRRMLELFASKGRLVRAFYYTAISEGEDYSPIKPLVDWLDYNGYTMVTKPAKEYTDALGRRKVKGNMDIELAIDVLEMSDSVDHVFIFSGDGDFRRLVESVQKKGVRVSVVSTMKSAPPMVADELRRQADNFVELAELAAHISRPTVSREPREVREARYNQQNKDQPDILAEDDDFGATDAGKVA